VAERCNWEKYFVDIVGIVEVDTVVVGIPVVAVEVVGSTAEVAVEVVGSTAEVAVAGIDIAVDSAGSAGSARILIAGRTFVKEPDAFTRNQMNAKTANFKSAKQSFHR
jgi:hypothetical protein